MISSLFVVVRYAQASLTHAQRGLQISSYGVWVVATAAIVMYLPFERALEADLKFQEMQSQLMGAMPGAGGVTPGADIFQ